MAMRLAQRLHSGCNAGLGGPHNLHGFVHNLPLNAISATCARAATNDGYAAAHASVIKCHESSGHVAFNMTHHIASHWLPSLPSHKSQVSRHTVTPPACVFTLHRIHAVSLGRQPHKPLMLFLHGCPEFWYSWRKQLRHYSLHYDAVAIDMRGYGQSDKPAGVASYALDVLASDVREVVRALGHERCVLVAHDWGGIVAWLVAGMYPEIVDR